MMGLAELQRAFQARVLHADRAIEPQLAHATHADFPDRLGAYVHGYRSRLVEALATTYPALQAALGAEEFGRRMRTYIESAPSTHFSVRYYGAGVADLMARGDGAADGDAGGDATAESGAQRATLSDLARWEWLLADVFDAPDDAPLAAADLGAVPPEAWAGVAFRFRASARRTQLHSNALEFWRAASGLCEPPVACAAAAPTEWLVWRRGVATFFRSLDAVETLAIDAALAGESFGTLCERLAAVIDAGEVALRAATLLRGWIAEELIADFVLPDRAA